MTNPKMIFTRRLHVGLDEAYRCRIDGALFLFQDFGGRVRAERAAKAHVDGLLRRQTEAGVSPRAGLKTRRRAYRNMSRQGAASIAS
jgi:hypothetical protein